MSNNSRQVIVIGILWLLGTILIQKDPVWAEKQNMLEALNKNHEEMHKQWADKNPVFRGKPVYEGTTGTSPLDRMNVEHEVEHIEWKEKNPLFRGKIGYEGTTKTNTLNRMNVEHEVEHIEWKEKNPLFRGKIGYEGTTKTNTLDRMNVEHEVEHIEWKEKNPLFRGKIGYEGTTKTNTLDRMNVEHEAEHIEWKEKNPLFRGKAGYEGSPKTSILDRMNIEHEGRHAEWKEKNPVFRGKVGYEGSTKTSTLERMDREHAIKHRQWAEKNPVFRGKATYEGQEDYEARSDTGRSGDEYLDQIGDYKLIESDYLRRQSEADSHAQAAAQGNQQYQELMDQVNGLDQQAAAYEERQRAMIDKIQYHKLEIDNLERQAVSNLDQFWHGQRSYLQLQKDFGPLKDRQNTAYEKIDQYMEEMQNETKKYRQTEQRRQFLLDEAEDIKEDVNEHQRLFSINM